MKGKLGDRARIQHIYESILEIESYVGDCELSDFRENSMMRFACIKQLEIIGEASNQVSEEVKGRFSNIEWRQIIGMRNIFVHEYFGIDAHLVWEIIDKDIPDLKKKVKEIIDSLE